MGVDTIDHGDALSRSPGVVAGIPCSRASYPDGVLRGRIIIRVRQSALRHLYRDQHCIGEISTGAPITTPGSTSSTPFGANWRTSASTSEFPMSEHRSRRTKRRCPPQNASQLLLSPAHVTPTSHNPDSQTVASTLNSYPQVVQHHRSNANKVHVRARQYLFHCGIRTVASSLVKPGPCGPAAR